MPPEDKPEGDVVWIGGYWAWDDERSDFMWVSGTWRTPPPGKKWVAGYWRDGSGSWQWVPGFWTMAAAEKAAEEITYYSAPPAPPEVAPPGPPPTPESFYVPGSYVWVDGRYAWRAGYWGRVQPGYVWVAAHYRWTPSGYIYIPGYWDLTVRRRGILYAPVVISPSVVTVGYVYTPTYAVSDTLFVDCLFVRPAYCHYYFGDYYSPGYRDRGFETCVVYSQRRYDSIIVYERYERRSDPTWFSVQISLGNERFAGRAPCPPRTFNVTNINVTNNYIVTPRQLAATRGTTIVRLDVASRQQAYAQATSVREVAHQRTLTEIKPAPAPGAAPHKAVYKVAEARPIGSGVSPSHNAVIENKASSPGVGKNPVPPGHPAVSATRPLPPVGSHTPGAKPMPPGHGQPPAHVPPGHAPPPSDKDKDKDKDKRP